MKNIPSVPLVFAGLTMLLIDLEWIRSYLRIVERYTVKHRALPGLFEIIFTDTWVENYGLFAISSTVGFVGICAIKLWQRQLGMAPVERK